MVLPDASLVLLHVLSHNGMVFHTIAVPSTLQIALDNFKAAFFEIALLFVLIKFLLIPEGLVMSVDNG